MAAAKESNQEDSGSWNAPDWAANLASPAKCLEELRQYIERQLAKEIGWYARGIRGVRRASRWLRICAITFTTFGGLIPTLSSMKLLGSITAHVFSGEAPEQIDFGQTGYLFLAIAGGAVLFDRFFGYSTAWMRYVTSMIALEKLRESFRLEWTSLARRFSSAQGEPAAELASQMVDLGKRVLLQAKEQTEKETQAWTNEFQSNLSQFEKDVRSQVEAGRPGGIEVRVPDGDRATDGFDLALDQMIVERITGTSGGIGFVPPGLHKISVSARAHGKTYSSSQMVTIAPASVAQLELKLGIPTVSMP